MTEGAAGIRHGYDAHMEQHYRREDADRRSRGIFWAVTLTIGVGVGVITESGLIGAAVGVLTGVLAGTGVAAWRERRQL
jgi:hypothetical protein